MLKPCTLSCCCVCLITAYCFTTPTLSTGSMSTLSVFSTPFIDTVLQSTSPSNLLPAYKAMQVFLPVFSVIAVCVLKICTHKNRNRLWTAVFIEKPIEIYRQSKNGDRHSINCSHTLQEWASLPQHEICSTIIKCNFKMSWLVNLQTSQFANRKLLKITSKATIWSFPWRFKQVDKTANWPVCNLSRPQVDQSATWLIASWFVGELGNH